MLQGNEMVERIRRAAEAGDDLPDPASPMGVTLHALADPSGEGYDKKFAAQIAALRPEWFDGASLAEPKGPGRR